MGHEKVRFIRYPGGKQRILNYILHCLPSRELIKGNFVEPFVGGGAVFFAVNPKCAVLADINKELIDLYCSIRRYPLRVWEIYESFPSAKKTCYEIRDDGVNKKSLTFRAAITLYLNRTCFKDMWRYNSNGRFNVCYGGQDRRWVLCKENLIDVRNRLKHASLKCSDFEEVVSACTEKDFIFVDPPYSHGKREMIHNHYVYSLFSYRDYKRLATTLKRASDKCVRWAMTTSSHPDILSLFCKYRINSLPRGTGKVQGYSRLILRKFLSIIMRSYPHERVI